MLSRLLYKFLSAFFVSLALTGVYDLVAIGQTSSPVPVIPGITKLPAPAAGEDEYHEDFSSISLKGSRFFPLPPALGQKDDHPQSSFIRERWQLFWRPADPMDVYICKPRGATNPPVILYLYGYPTDTERYKDDSWCSAATNGGVAAVGLISANTGPRLDMQPPGTTFFSDFQVSLAASVHDVQMAIDYLASRGDLDMNRIGMFGQGSGGSIAILASAADARIKAIDVLTPWGDWPEFFATSPSVAKDKRTKFTSPEYLAKVANLDPLKWLPKVQAQEVRIQDVQDSPPMTNALQERMEAAAPKTAVINQFGDTLAFAHHAPGAGMGAWLSEQLQAIGKAQVAKEDSERIHLFPAEAVNPFPNLAPPKKTDP